MMESDYLSPALILLHQQNYKAAYELLRDAYDSGDLSVAHCLGLMYLRGDYVTRDVNYGLSLLRRAAAAGNGSSAYILGTTLPKYALDKTEPVEIKEFLEFAAKKGVIEAPLELAKHYYYGNLFARNYMKALYWAKFPTPGHVFPFPFLHLNRWDSHTETVHIVKSALRLKLYVSFVWWKLIRPVLKATCRK